jgi:hypothetical protein
MKPGSIALSICLAGLTANAQTLTTLRVSSETVPAGGLAQVKLLLTSPKPITSGNTFMDMSAVSFDSIDGIALFSNTGDVSGAAVVNDGKVSVQFTSPNGTFGANADYPLLTIALTLSKNAMPGQIFPVHLDTSASIFQDLTGSPLAFEYQQGSITAGGSVNISNVVPGGGVLPAGANFSIFGSGFSAKTRITLRNLKTSSIQVVSANEIRVTLKEAALLDGTLMQVVNPDGSTDNYYSYLRGVNIGQSAQPLLARTTPVFSINTAYEAILPPTVSPLNSDYFTAIALQNPNLAAITVTVESHSAAGALIGSAQVALPPGSRITREVSELLGAGLPAGGYLHVLAALPVQMMGLLGNNQTGAVTPVAVTVISAAAPPPPQDPGVSNGSGGSGGGGGKGQ